MRDAVLILVALLVLVLIGVDVYATTEFNRWRVIAGERQQVIHDLFQQLEYKEAVVDLLSTRVTDLEQQNEVLLQALQIWQGFSKGEWSIEAVPSSTR